MNDLLLLLIDPNGAALDCLTEASGGLRRVQIRRCAGEAEFWEHLPKAAAGLLAGVLILAWDMPADFILRLKNGSAQPVPVVACVSTGGDSEVDALYEVGANCVVKLDGDLPTDVHRLKTLLEFWCGSAILPRSVRAAGT